MSTGETAALQEGVVRIRSSDGFQTRVREVEVCCQLVLYSWQLSFPLHPTSLADVKHIVKQSE